MIGFGADHLNGSSETRSKSFDSGQLHDEPFDLTV
jgi:hypothetical protein